MHLLHLAGMAREYKVIRTCPHRTKIYVKVYEDEKLQPWFQHK